MPQQKLNLLPSSVLISVATSQMESHSHLAHARPSAPLPASINFTPQLLISIAAT
jgi:hypothetical protein